MGKRVGSNAVCCTQCTKWIHGRCKKIKKQPAVLQKKRRCWGWLGRTRGGILYDEVEILKGFCHLEDIG